MSYKTTNGLMRHLRDTDIKITGSKEKQELINTGYFHGYKGYRFFKNSQTRLPFTSYKEVYATIQYDSALKSLFYDKIMFIETAVKNIALDEILINTNSEYIQSMYNKVVCGYNNVPGDVSNKQRKVFQQNKLNLQRKIQNSLAEAYKNENPQITHFYNNSKYYDVPIWAIFEIMTLGEFGYLLSCLTYDMRDDISRKLGLNLTCDTSRQLIYKYIYTLKDLRNAIAHNAVIFDARFRNIDPTGNMKQCLKQEIGEPFINFKTIDDYVILVCYYLKLLKVSKTEIKQFIHSFEKITEEYKKSVNSAVAEIAIHPKLNERMTILENYIKNT